MNAVLLSLFAAVAAAQDPNLAPAPPAAVEQAPADATAPAPKSGVPWVPGLVGSGTSCLGNAIGLLVGAIPMFALGAIMEGPFAIIGLPLLCGCALGGTALGALIPTLVMQPLGLPGNIAAVLVPTVIGTLAATVAGLGAFLVGYTVGQTTESTPAGVGSAAVVAGVSVPIVAVVTGLSYLGVVVLAGAIAD